MKQYKLTSEEIIRVAHLAAERATVSCGASTVESFVKQYTDRYCLTRLELEKYNHSVSETAQ